MASFYRIAGWRFDPAEPVLRDGVREVPLEDRAARALAMLCEHRGTVVSKDALLARVWEGRTVSSNSVSIVIGSLRRALEDDLQTPVHIVTVARRGYRLTEETAVAGPRDATGRRRKLWLLIPASAAAAVIWLPVKEPVAIVVNAPQNATGSAALNGLAVSLAPVVVAAVAGLNGVEVMDTGANASRARRVRLRSRIILWDGAPELAMVATDMRTRTVIWTGFAAGPAAALARHVRARIGTLQQRLPR